MKRLAVLIAAVVLLIGFGWRYGTPYHLDTTVAHPAMEKDPQADWKWFCSYRGLQGERIVRRGDRDCPKFRLFRWDNTCVAPGEKVPDDPAVPYRSC